MKKTWRYRTNRPIRGGLILYEVLLELKPDFVADMSACERKAWGPAATTPLLVLARDPRQARLVAEAHSKEYIYRPRRGVRPYGAVVVGLWMGARGPQPILDHSRIAEAALKAARTGGSLRGVAGEFGCSAERVRQILRAKGLVEAYRDAVARTRDDVARFLEKREEAS